MNTPNFESNIREYAKAINVPKAIMEAVNYFNSNYEEANKKLYNMPFYGALTGGAIDSVMAEYLTENSNSNLSFVKGNDARNEDCVCVENKFYNTEIKTTCNPKQIMVGARSNCAEGNAKKSTKYVTDDYHFYIFTAFNRPQTPDDKLTIANIWIGMMKPSDWSTSKSNRSSGAWVKRDVFNSQFINVKDLY